MDLNEGTYVDRVRNIFDMLNPLALFITKSEVEECLKNRGDPACEKTLSKVIHPDTQQPIFAPLRASAIVPVNSKFSFLDWFMLAAATPAMRVISQITNQTYNALHYKANSNKSNETEDSVIFASYLGSVFSSVGTVLFIQKKAPPKFLKFAPFFAVAAADILNLSIIRHNEFIHGIKVYDSETKAEVGISRIAGAMAVASCVAGRVFAAGPILLVPPLFHFKSHAATAACVASMIMGSVPLTFGLFRQNAQVQAGYLEKGLNVASGRYVTYYKGI